MARNFFVYVMTQMENDFIKHNLMYILFIENYLHEGFVGPKEVLQIKVCWSLKSLFLENVQLSNIYKPLIV